MHGVRDAQGAFAPRSSAPSAGCSKPLPATPGGAAGVMGHVQGGTPNSKVPPKEAKRQMRMRAAIQSLLPSSDTGG